MKRVNAIFLLLLSFSMRGDNKIKLNLFTTFNNIWLKVYKTYF